MTEHEPFRGQLFQVPAQVHRLFGGLFVAGRYLLRDQPAASQRY
jgi:hypothetical protein